jgi:exopolyphosphatase/guanosine-5'-triphosphate,3'-diphosphate pyrophosphatase
VTKIAIVDVGTNTTRLLIAAVRGGHVTDEYVRRSTVTRLGAGVDASGRLHRDALRREHAALVAYHQTISAHAVERTVAVMTSAVRDAENGAEFASAVAADYGFEVRVLSGEEEAMLTYRGATADLPEISDRQLLVIDIGGGSTELIIGRGTQPSWHVSTQAGVVRQSDRHIDGDPPDQRELEAVAQDVRQILEQAVPPEQRGGITEAIAVAGTPTSLAAIDQQLDPYDPEKVHGYRLSAGAREQIFARLKSMGLEERQRVRGLHPARAQVILPGIVILRQVMELFAIDQVTVSEHDILRGAAVSFAER